MTAPDLAALIERLQGFNPPDRTIASQRDYSQAIHDAAAALVQLRDAEALARGKIAEQMIEIANLRGESQCFTCGGPATAHWCDLHRPTALDELIARMSNLADYFSPPSGAGTDHAISCNCAMCEWADDLRQAAHELERLRAENAELRSANSSLATKSICHMDRSEPYFCPKAPCEHCLQWQRHRADVAAARVAELEAMLGITPRAESLIRKARAQDVAAIVAEKGALRAWLNNNMTHYNTSEAGARPILAEFGKRVWYHVTDDCVSFPFSAAIDAALAELEKLK